MNAVELYNDLFALGVLCIIPLTLSGFIWVVSSAIDRESIFCRVMFIVFSIMGLGLIVASGVVQCTHPEVKAYLQEKNKVICECSCCHCNVVPGTSEN